jgi:hypothetical protein
MAVSTEILYVPVSPPQDTAYVGRYLDDELNRISTSLQQLYGYVRNALPWKGVYALVTGGTTATNFVTTLTYNTAAPTRTGVGVYRFTLTYPVIKGVQVIDRCFPRLFVEVVPPYPADTVTFFINLVVVNAATGVFDVSVFGGHLPASGKLELIPYDVRVGDKLYVSGDFSLDADVQSVAFNLNVLGEF